MGATDPSNRRLVILASGSGTNLQRIIEACADGVIDASVDHVVSDRPDAYALERAAHAGIATIPATPGR